MKHDILIFAAGFLGGAIACWFLKPSVTAELASLDARLKAVEASLAAKVQAAANTVASDAKKL